MSAAEREAFENRKREIPKSPIFDAREWVQKLWNKGSTFKDFVKLVQVAYETGWQARAELRESKIFTRPEFAIEGGAVPERGDEQASAAGREPNEYDESEAPHPMENNLTMEDVLGLSQAEALPSQQAIERLERLEDALRGLLTFTQDFSGPKIDKLNKKAKIALASEHPKALPSQSAIERAARRICDLNLRYSLPKETIAEILRSELGESEPAPKEKA